MVRVCSFLIGLAMLGKAWAGDVANPSLEKEVESYLAETSATSPGDTTFKAFWKNGLQFETATKSFTAHLGGRIAFDSAWFGSDDYGGAQQQDSWYFRQVWVTLEGTIYTNFFYKIDIDFAGGATTLKNIYMGLKDLGPVGTLTVGQFKQPFSLSELGSSRFITFMERAAATQAFVPAYQDGFMLFNNFLEEKRLLAAISAYKVTATGTGVAADNGGYAMAARVAAFFLEDEDSHRILHVGFGYLFADTPAGTRQYRARPGIGTGVRFVDTGAVPADDETAYVLELLFTWRTFHVQAEYYWAELHGGVAEPTFQGFYVEVGWFISGGRVNYSRQKKVVDRPIIDRRFHDGGSGAGAWQVALRYDSIDLSDSGVAGGFQEALTVGVNWYWNANMRVMLNVIWADVSEGGPFGEGSLMVFGTRFQLDF